VRIVVVANNNMVDAEDDYEVAPNQKQTEGLKQAAQDADVVDSGSDEHATASEDDDDQFGSLGN
jgi:hypothetical protein